jgi:hypothetical protein
VHAKYLDEWAAVRLTAPTGWAVIAVQVGSYRASIPYPTLTHITANRHDLNAQFMSEHPGIGKEWLITMKRVVVSATDAHLPDAHDGLSGRWHKWFGHGERAKFTRSFENDTTHLFSLSFQILTAVRSKL